MLGGGGVERGLREVSSAGTPDGWERQKHRRRCRPSVRLPFERFDRNEAVFPVEPNGIRFGVDDDADAPIIVGHPDGQPKHEAQEQSAQPLPLGRLIDAQSRQAENRQRIMRELFPSRRRQLVDLDMSGGNRREAEETAVVDGDVGDAQMMSELVLTRKLVKEPIEVRVSRAEG